MRERVAAVAVAVPFLVGTLSGTGSADREVAFRFQDPAIVESSGLVVLDSGLVVTTNDSGDSGRVFTVDPATGRTVGVTSWSPEPEDVEALAPVPGADEVWVGDVGDNGASRESVTVLRVPVGPGDRTVEPAAYELVYPDGARDAETLVADDEGRLYVATKGVLGGHLYAAPATLDAAGPNRLEQVGRVLPIATDGAFVPGEDVLVLRDYGRLVAYAFPSLQELGEVDLPDQQQGEGLAVGADGTAYVSSEGLRAPVLEVSLPSSEEAAADPSPSATPSATPTPPAGSREGRELPQAETTERPAWPWFVTGWLGLGVIVVLLLALRRR